MKIRIVLIVLSTIVLSVTMGCTAYPKGIGETRVFTGEEKAELIKTALDTDEVQHALETREVYQITLKWALVRWEGGHKAATSYYDYGTEDSEGEIEEDKERYIAVVIRMGDIPEHVVNFGIRVIIQPDTLQVIDTPFEPITPTKMSP